MERASSPLLHVHAPLVVQPPKSRGRPRASYAQTGEFDLGLIREYRSRPALYDRNNKRFKDKIHSAQLWIQMSHKLGYEVSTLRERMITLRNRYNIEKRRLENLSGSSASMVSQWPLYENLSFLSEHIRSRRSYKTQSKLEGPQEDEDDEEQFDNDDMYSELNGHAKRIKHEQDNDYDEGDMYDCCDRQLPVTTVLNIPHNTQIMSQEDYSSQLNGSDTLNGEVPHASSMSDHMDGLRQPELVMATTKHKRMLSIQGAGSLSAKRRLEVSTSAAAAASANTEPPSALSAALAAPPVNPKYRAFGEFMSLVLTELPSTTAMRLVASFSNELTQATIAHERSQQQPQQEQQQQKNNQQQQQQQQLGSGSGDQQPSSMDETDD